MPQNRNAAFVARGVNGVRNVRSVMSGPEWQTAAETLLLGAERGGPTIFARVRMMLHGATLTDF